MNIVLVGFMGSGKTTIGRKLALRLGYHFIDTDHTIEEAQGVSISEIFATAGESKFRELETRLLEELVQSNNCVVATGGGMVMNPHNRELLHKIGKMVYLKVEAEELLSRIQRSNHRPLMNVEDPAKRLHDLMNEREPVYAQSDIVIDTKNQLPQLIASAIIRSL